MCGHGCVRVVGGINEEKLKKFLQKREEQIEFLKKGKC